MSVTHFKCRYFFRHKKIFHEGIVIDLDMTILITMRYRTSYFFNIKGPVALQLSICQDC